MSRAAPVHGNGTSAFLASRRRGRLPAATYAPKLAAAALARSGCAGGRVRRPAGSIVRDAAGRGRVSALQGRVSFAAGKRRSAHAAAAGGSQRLPSRVTPHGSKRADIRGPEQAPGWTVRRQGQVHSRRRPSPPHTHRSATLALPAAGVADSATVRGVATRQRHLRGAARHRRWPAGWPPRQRAQAPLQVGRNGARESCHRKEAK